MLLAIDAQRLAACLKGQCGIITFLSEWSEQAGQKFNHGRKAGSCRWLPGIKVFSRVDPPPLPTLGSLAPLLSSTHAVTTSAWPGDTP